MESRRRSKYFEANGGIAFPCSYFLTFIVSMICLPFVTVIPQVLKHCYDLRKVLLPLLKIWHLYTTQNFSKFL
jgi:hypothetical protein